MIARLPTLGTGIYQLADVARYVRAHPSTVRSWFSTRELLQAEYGRVAGHSSLSFHDLIDTLVAAQFRRHGVMMRVVRKAYRALEKTLGTAHPFCHRGLYTDGRSIIVATAKSIRNEVLEEAISRQQLFEHIKERLDDVAHSARTELAERWSISPGVVIDPRIAMGLPVIVGTGVTTHVIHGAYHANGRDAALVGGLYGLTVSEVKDAVRFEDGLRTAA
jgi:uncharacterized protein (DUF433 family)